MDSTSSNTVVRNLRLQDISHGLRDKNNIDIVKRGLGEECKLDRNALLSMTVSDLWLPLRSSSHCNTKQFRVYLDKLKRDQTNCKSCNMSMPSDCTIDINDDAKRQGNIYIKQEIKLTLISFCCIELATFITAVFVVIAQHRLPERSVYQPLPDIVRDAFPYMPALDQASEYTILCLLVSLVPVLFYHKYRLLIFRRYVSQYSAITVLRCSTMLLTSLSVPSIHTVCEKKELTSLSMLLSRSLNITLGCGMSLNGVRNCGDFMFSGHTFNLTLICLTYRDAIPSKFQFLHKLIWFSNIFGMFAIITAQKHYTIDVFIGYIVTYAVFIHYQNAVTFRILMKGNADQPWRTWFPLQNFFEGNNEYVHLNHVSFYQWSSNRKSQHYRLLMKPLTIGRLIFGSCVFTCGKKKNSSESVIRLI